MKQRAYAEGTTVQVESSKAELDRLLAKHGATQRLLGTDEEHGCAWCVFTLGGRQVRLKVPVPTADDYQPKRGQEPRGWWSWPAGKRAEWCRGRSQQVERERWRALVLLVKAKLELVQLGISTVEREFLADLRLPNGSTVHEAIGAQIADAYTTGRMPPLLGPATEDDRQVLDAAGSSM